MEGTVRAEVEVGVDEVGSSRGPKSAYAPSQSAKPAKSAVVWWRQSDWSRIQKVGSESEIVTEKAPTGGSAVTAVTAVTAAAKAAARQVALGGWAIRWRFARPFQQSIRCMRQYQSSSLAPLPPNRSRWLLLRLRQLLQDGGRDCVCFGLNLRSCWPLCCPEAVAAAWAGVPC